MPRIISLIGGRGVSPRSISHILIFYLTRAVRFVWSGKIGKHCQMWEGILLGSMHTGTLAHCVHWHLGTLYTLAHYAHWQRFDFDPTPLSIHPVIGFEKTKISWLHQSIDRPPWFYPVIEHLKEPPLPPKIFIICLYHHHHSLLALHNPPHQISLRVPKMGQQSSAICFALLFISSPAQLSKESH